MKFGVFGAGAIGSYVGVELSSVGHPVTLIGRGWLRDRQAELSATNHEGRLARPQELAVSEDPAALADTDVILVTVKSGDTPAAVEALRPIVRKETLVISLQNGIRNVEVLRALDAEVVAGMVTFNVIWEEAHLRQATFGPILVGPSPHPGIAAFVGALKQAGEKAGVRRDIDAVQMGKLLINLNNGICAVAGIPIAQFIRSRPLRIAYSICIREGFAVAERAGRDVASIGIISPWLIARALLWPDWLVLRLARGMVAIDPRARSSTLQDLDRRKTTEIDFLNGEIVRLAKEHGIEAPANAFVTDVVHRLEQMQGDLHFLTPEEVVRGVAADHGRSAEMAKG